MIYRLTCPGCDAATEHPFVRLGAVARCPGCGKTWRIEARHCSRRTSAGEPASKVSNDWAVPLGAPGGKRGAEGVDEGRSVGPGSGLAVGEELDQDGAAEAIVGMATLEETLTRDRDRNRGTAGGSGGGGAALSEPEELKRERGGAAGRGRRGRRAAGVMAAGFGLAVIATGFGLWMRAGAPAGIDPGNSVDAGSSGELRPLGAAGVHDSSAPQAQPILHREPQMADVESASGDAAEGVEDGR